MFKDEKKRNTLSNELTQKSTIDTVVLFFIFLVLYVVVEHTELEPILITAIIVLLFILAVFVFEFTKKQVKKSIDGAVYDVIDQTDDETKKIEVTTNSQKENINLSFAKLTNIVSLLENLKDYIASMNNVINETRNKTHHSLDFTNTEHLAVKANIEKMFAIRHKIQTIAELILELSEFIQSISSTIGVVEDIAEQTNLLALNAAVEAARAGEHGKGFAVVAGEIRKLADESKQATTKITSLITDIQQTTNSTVMATEEGTKEIESGIDLAHSIGSNIEQLIGFMSEQGIDSATLVGHSFGCRVAMVVAATRPELVERLLLVAPAGLRRFSLKRWFKVKAYKLRKKLGFKSAEQSGSDDYRNCSDEMKRTFVKVVNQDLSRYAKRITSQTIIVNGRTDTATPLKHARRLNRLIKNSELVEINGDHFAFFYVPQAFADTVKIFVRQGVTS